MIWVAIGSSVISAIALFFNGYSFLLSRQGRIADNIFSIWEKYEDLTRAHSESLTAAKIEQERCLTNLFVFFENICFLYNKNYVPKPVRENIEFLFNDFIRMVDAGIPFEDVLRHMKTRDDAYGEIEAFLRKHRRGREQTDGICSTPAATSASAGTQAAAG